MMKLLFGLLLVLSSPLSFAAEAPQVPAFLIGQWTEARRDADMDIVTIGADLSFSYEKSRNVSEGVFCRYKLVGVVDLFGPPSAEELARFRGAGKQVDPTYTLGYAVSAATVAAVDADKPACVAYVKELTDKIAAGPQLFAWSFKDLSDRVLLDPWFDSVLLKN